MESSATVDALANPCIETGFGVYLRIPLKPVVGILQLLINLYHFRWWHEIDEIAYENFSNLEK